MLADDGQWARPLDSDRAPAINERRTGDFFKQLDSLRLDSLGVVPLPAHAIAGDSSAE